jgi:hypothetical protein
MTLSAIEAAFRKLPILPSEEWRLPSVVDGLAGIAEANSKPTPAQPSRAGRAAVREQLDGIAHQCNDLANALASLSQGALDALADAGMLQIAPGLQTHAGLQSILRKVSEVAQNANADCLPESANGRQRNYLAGGVAAILAKDYWRLTGKKPTRANRAKTSRESEEYSPFYELVKDVFLATGIEASPAAYAKEAVAGFMEEKAE